MVDPQDDALRETFLNTISNCGCTLPGTYDDGTSITYTIVGERETLATLEEQFTTAQESFSTLTSEKLNLDNEKQSLEAEISVL